MLEAILHSMGGKITLIKATLINMLVYYMSLFKMPSKIIQKVEKLQRDFLWEGGMAKKDHLINWHDVCRPKELGGLGLGRIKKKNMALMGKWLWCFSMERDSLWHSTTSHKYGHHPNGWDCISQSNASWSLLWKNICHLYLIFLSYTRLALDNGRSIKFWKDLWWGESTLASLYPRLFLISSQQEAMVTDIMPNSSNDISWNFLFSRDLYD